MRLTAGSVSGPTSGSSDLYSRLSCTLVIVSPPSSKALQVEVTACVTPRLLAAGAHDLQIMLLQQQKQTLYVIKAAGIISKVHLHSTLL